MTTPRRLPHSTRRAPVAAILALALALPSAAAAYERTFPANSLIIPTQMEYQTDCGMVSAYGLVYTILYKNKQLVADGKKPVTIYSIVEPRKKSHHRCNTSTDALPDFGGYNDNDGCDFAIESAAGQPVAFLQNNNTELAPFSFDTTRYNSDGTVSRSGSTAVIGLTKRVVKYQGGLWVIDASDRTTVLNLLATDPLFSKFRSGGTCGGLPRPSSGALYQTSIHSARIGFKAPVARMMNEKPALIALVGADYVGILQAYLVNAGLADIPNARGCPVAGYPAGCTGHGEIYDVLVPFDDFVAKNDNTLLGELNAKDPATKKNVYQVVWAPHWEEDTDYQDPCRAGAPPNAFCVGGTYSRSGEGFRANAFKNFAAFADAGFGVFAECASIASFEGSYEMGAAAADPIRRRCQCNVVSATSPACTPLGDIQDQLCGAGTTAACGYCYSCPSGTLVTSPCDNPRCVVTGSECAAGAQYNPADQNCYRCTSRRPNLDMSVQPPQCTGPGYSPRDATQEATVGAAPATSAPLGCPAGYSLVPVPATGAVELSGHDATRFQMSAGIEKNGLGGSWWWGGWGGDYVALDCTDTQVPTGGKYHYAGTPSRCMDFHAAEGGPGNIFSQKGNFSFTGTMGHVSHWRPDPDVHSIYKSGVQRLASSSNSDPALDDWDFVSVRHKDDDPNKGMVVYLSGHDFQGNAGGNRLVLNTMLNLGFTDEGVELARSEPVGYTTWGKDAAGNMMATALTVFQGTYVQRQPPGPYQDWINYNPVAPHAWRFPYIDGHLRAYPLDNIGDWTEFADVTANWDAASLPKPKERKVFTALGGSANEAWSLVNWDFRQTRTGCSLSSGEKDSSGASICALSYELAKCSTIPGVTKESLGAAETAATVTNAIGLFVQQVRGYCVARDAVSKAAIMEPTDVQCDFYTNSAWQRNEPKLGGVDHSSPAIVGPSPYIGNKVKEDGTVIPLATRPVVAYVGGRDGMLHAIFVSGDTAWSAEGATLPTPPTGGSLGGTELWAFIPPGQICGLATNSAMVDANISVMDVFGDFPRDVDPADGVFDLTKASERPSGIREWRTILTATAGEGASEIFALDVTNPLKPVLLWRISGPENRDGRFDLNGDGDFADTDDHLDVAIPSTYATKWFNSDDGAQGAHAWIPTDYLTTNTAVLNGIKSGRYDFHNLGYAFGTATGTLFSGNAFQFVTYVATSTADHAQPTPYGYRGIEVFAIDVVTGQKLWQWQNRYTRKNAAGTVIADNGIPGRPALVDVDADGSVDRIYAGDLEGHLWELSARDGRNLNYLVDGNGTRRSYPLFGTPAMLDTVDGASLSIDLLAAFTAKPGTALAEQPLTTPIGVGRFTEVPPALEPYLKGRIVVAQGTMGVDWSIASTQPGHVYAVPVFPVKDTRLVEPISRPSLDPLLYGILTEGTYWDTVLGVGERVYGMPKIADNTMYVNTSYGSFTGDFASTAYTDRGRTLKVAASGTEVDATGSKRPGGVLLFGNYVIVSSGVEIKKQQQDLTGGVENRVRDRSTPTSAKTWEQRPDGSPPFVR